MGEALRVEIEKQRLLLGVFLLLNDGWDGVGEMELLQILRPRETAEGYLPQVILEDHTLEFTAWTNTDPWIHAGSIFDHF